MNNLEKSIQTLKGSEYTCVVCSDEEILTSTARGVAPLLMWIDEGRDFSSFSAADKVVGNGAAFLYVILKVRELWAGVISQTALDTLKANNISVTYDVLTDAIMNRDKTGFCPVESAVKGITDPQEALAAVRTRLREMKNNQRR